MTPSVGAVARVVECRVTDSQRSLLDPAARRIRRRCPGRLGRLRWIEPLSRQFSVDRGLPVGRWTPHLLHDMTAPVRTLDRGHRPGGTVSATMRGTGQLLCDGKSAGLVEPESLASTPAPP